jgi:hypothetical protein
MTFSSTAFDFLKSLSNICCTTKFSSLCECYENKETTSAVVTCNPMRYGECLVDISFEMKVGGANFSLNPD